VVSVGEWIDTPDVPDWVWDPKDKILEIVVNWIVNGIWSGVQELVGWILTLFNVAVIGPLEAAGQGLLDAFGPVGDLFVDLAWDLSAPLRSVAGSGPFAPILTWFMTAVFLVVLAYAVRGVVEFAKGVTWK
jgi:hypothetical protein